MILDVAVYYSDVVWCFWMMHEAVCCGKLQCVVASCSALWQVVVGCGKLQWVVACFSERLQGEVGC